MPNKASTRYLNALRAAKGNPSCARISDALDGLPSRSTIERMFRGDVVPSIETVRPVILWLEGSMAEYFAALDEDGIQPQESTGPVPAAPEDPRSTATGKDLDRMTDTLVQLLLQRDDRYEERRAAQAGVFEHALDVLRDAHEQDLQSLRQEHERAAAELRARHTHAMDELRAQHMREIASKDRINRYLLAACSVLTLFVMAVLLIDIFNPTIGWIRRAVQLVLGRSV